MMVELFLRIPNTAVDKLAKSATFDTVTQPARLVGACGMLRPGPITT
jgi:hypothetical protein